MTARTYTLTPDVAGTFSVPGEWNHVAVFHKGDVAEPAYATLKGADPVAGEDDVLEVPSGTRRELHWRNTTGNEVRIISAGAATIEVEWG